MKKLILFASILICIPFFMNAQGFKNEIGISFLEVSMPYQRFYEYETNNPLFVNSLFYSTQPQLLQLPKFYFATRLYKRWKARVSLNAKRYKSTFDDYIAYDLIYDPFPNRDVIDFRNMHHITNLALGLQFDFIKKKKILMYVAADAVVTKSHQRSNFTYQYKETKIIEKQQYSDVNYYKYQERILLGLKYNFSDKLSSSFEIGTDSDDFYPLSRLSINYHF